MTQYVIDYADQDIPQVELPLTEEQWFAIFLSGRYAGKSVLRIARKDDPSKFVVFQENLNGPELS